ncbi:MAG: N-acetyl-gamma-glutamyl-phosphate reductase [Acidobacteriota bacterium]|nr:N-acetyl-gamma-glutamyl-phosphate reductase [Acidobacteriota bacterium]
MRGGIQTAVVGATGYAGFELARLLARHPQLAQPLLLGREQDGREEANSAELADAFPHVSGNGHLPIEPFTWEKLASAGVEVLFLATPHQTSREMVPQAIARGLKVVDLSGAWRLNDPANRAVYGFHENGNADANEKLQQQAVYGLPELHRAELAGARLVANPGCYATSIILALAPLAQAGLLDAEHGVVCDAKSGVSGAGKAPTSKTHFVEVADNLSAYSVFGHRHTGEILEQLSLAAEQVVFTPHLLPIPRGILSTVYGKLAQPATEAEIDACFRVFYAGCPWVRVFGTKLPQIQYSLRTNFCDLGFALAPDGRRLVIVSCLDNLMKGAAGQAVQNLNLMFGWDEKAGLD